MAGYYIGLSSALYDTDPGSNPLLNVSFICHLLHQVYGLIIDL